MKIQEATLYIILFISMLIFGVVFSVSDSGFSISLFLSGVFWWGYVLWLCLSTIAASFIAKKGVNIGFWWKFLFASICSLLATILMSPMLLSDSGLPILMIYWALSIIIFVFFFGLNIIRKRMFNRI